MGDGGGGVWVGGVLDCLDPACRLHNETHARFREKTLDHMPGCAWWEVPGHQAACTALTAALGPGPYLEGLAGYRAIVAAIQESPVLKANASVKQLVAQTLCRDRMDILLP
jgi:hypothetical protein